MESGTLTTASTAPKRGEIILHPPKRLRAGGGAKSVPLPQARQEGVTRMTPLERLKAKIPDAADGSKDALLSAYLDDAKDYILNYTGLDDIPEQLEGAQAQLALIYYNRQGIEGEQSHHSGGVSRAMFGDNDVPASIRGQLVQWRLLPVARRTRG